MESSQSSGGICLANLSSKTLWVISPKKNLFPATFWKMSRPKARNHFGRYISPKTPRLYWKYLLRGMPEKRSIHIGGQISTTFPWRIFWETSPKTSHQTTPQQIPEVLLGSIFQNYANFTIRRLRDSHCIRFLDLKVSDRNIFSAKKNFPGLVQKLSGSSGICPGVVWWQFLGRCFPKYFSGKCRGNLSFNVCWFFQAYVAKGIFKTHAVSLGISPKMISCLWARHLPKGRWKYFFLGRYHPEGFQREICQTDPPWGKGWCHTTP